MKKLLTITLAVVLTRLLAVPGFAAGVPGGGVPGGSVSFEADLFIEAYITADDIPWIIEQARDIGETKYGFKWSDWKDPDKDYYLGGYNPSVCTTGKTKEQIVEGIEEYYFDAYRRLGDVYSFYIEIKPFDEFGPGSAEDHGPNHFWIYVYRG